MKAVTTIVMLLQWLLRYINNRAGVAIYGSCIKNTTSAVDTFENIHAILDIARILDRAGPQTVNGFSHNSPIHNADIYDYLCTDAYGYMLSQTN